MKVFTPDYILCLSVPIFYAYLRTTMLDEQDFDEVCLQANFDTKRVLWWHQILGFRLVS